MLNDMIQTALGKKIQTLADGGGKTNPQDLAVAKSIFPNIPGIAQKVQAYIETAYGVTEDAKDVTVEVDSAVALMTKLGILP